MTCCDVLHVCGALESLSPAMLSAQTPERQGSVGLPGSAGCGVCLCVVAQEEGLEKEERKKKQAEEQNKLHGYYKVFIAARVFTVDQDNGWRRKKSNNKRNETSVDARPLAGRLWEGNEGVKQTHRSKLDTSTSTKEIQ